MHARLTEAVTPFNDALRAPDVARIIDMTTDAGRAIADQIVTQQASFIAFSNDFMILTWMTALSIPFVFAIGRIHGRTKGAPDTAAAAASGR
jgi:DHA2 family multidrug resistance protein